MLAKKLDNNANNDILEYCRTNLRMLDAFVHIVNIPYQRIFAGIIRQMLRQKAFRPFDIGPGASNEDFNIMSSAHLDQEVLKFRWIAGFRGLLCDQSYAASIE